jgi:hypothetical protein
MRSLLLLFLLLPACAEESPGPEVPLCYDEPFNSWCVQVEFATLDDGMLVSRANDLDNRLYGVQYDVRLRMSRAMIGGYMTLTNNGVYESTRLIYTNDTNMIGFAAYTLILGPNELVAELRTGDDILVDKVVITIYVE